MEHCVSRDAGLEGLILGGGSSEVPTWECKQKRMQSRVKNKGTGAGGGGIFAPPRLSSQHASFSTEGEILLWRDFHHCPLPLVR